MNEDEYLDEDVVDEEIETNEVLEPEDSFAEQIRQRVFDRQAAKEREARRVSRQMGDTLDDR